MWFYRPHHLLLHSQHGSLPHSCEDGLPLRCGQPNRDGLCMGLCTSNVLILWVFKYLAQYWTDLEIVDIYRCKPWSTIISLDIPRNTLENLSEKQSRLSWKHNLCFVTATEKASKSWVLNRDAQIWTFSPILIFLQWTKTDIYQLTFFIKWTITPKFCIRWKLIWAAFGWSVNLWMVEPHITLMLQVLQTAFYVSSFDTMKICHTPDIAAPLQLIIPRCSLCLNIYCSSTLFYGHGKYLLNTCPIFNIWLLWLHCGQVQHVNTIFPGAFKPVLSLHCTNTASQQTVTAWTGTFSQSLTERLWRSRFCLYLQFLICWTQTGVSPHRHRATGNHSTWWLQGLWVKKALRVGYPESILFKKEKH